jgi:hypothetical protein
VDHVALLPEELVAGSVLTVIDDRPWCGRLACSICDRRRPRRQVARPVGRDEQDRVCPGHPQLEFEEVVLAQAFVHSARLDPRLVDDRP